MWEQLEPRPELRSGNGVIKGGMGRKSQQQEHADPPVRPRHAPPTQAALPTLSVFPDHYPETLLRETGAGQEGAEDQKDLRRSKINMTG